MATQGGDAIISLEDTSDNVDVELENVSSASASSYFLGRRLLAKKDTELTKDTEVTSRTTNEKLMTLTDVPVPERVPSASTDSVEKESNISLENQHPPSRDFVDLEDYVPSNAPSLDQHAAKTSQPVDESNTMGEATEEVAQSSDKRPAKPPGGVELGIVHMPPHLENKDPMWSANEMRLLQKSDYNKVITELRTRPIKKSRFFIPLCKLKTYAKVCPIVQSDVDMLANELVKGYRDGDRVLDNVLLPQTLLAPPITGPCVRMRGLAMEERIEKLYGANSGAASEGAVPEDEGQHDMQEGGQGEQSEQHVQEEMRKEADDDASPVLTQNLGEEIDWSVRPEFMMYTHPNRFVQR